MKVLSFLLISVLVIPLIAPALAVTADYNPIASIVGSATFRIAYSYIKFLGNLNLSGNDIIDMGTIHFMDGTSLSTGTGGGTGGGNITGSGTSGYLTRWYNSTSINASSIWENGNQVKISLPLNASNNITTTGNVTANQLIGNNLHTSVSAYTNYLIGNSIGDIDMTINPWYFQGVDVNFSGDINATHVIASGDVNATHISAGDYVSAANDMYTSFLISNFVGAIDMSGDPWYMSNSLDVTGDLNVYENLSVLLGYINTTGFVLPTGASPGYLLSSDTNGNASWRSAASLGVGNVTGSGAAGKLAVWYNSTQLTNNSYIRAFSGFNGTSVEQTTDSPTWTLLNNSTLILNTGANFVECNIMGAATAAATGIQFWVNASNVVVGRHSLEYWGVNAGSKAHCGSQNTTPFYCLAISSGDPEVYQPIYYQGYFRNSAPGVFNISFRSSAVSAVNISAGSYCRLT